MLNLCEVALATNSKELLNSPQNHAVVTMPLGMVLPSGKGKRQLWAEAGQSASRQRNSMPHDAVEQGKANGVRVL